MTLEPKQDAGFDFACAVERAYAALLVSRSMEPAAKTDAEPSLGGMLLYAGELNSDARALLVAGNVAGAASLAATADAAAQKQAIRDGVADFLVNSLDEALRILKNEIRKREAVAVCITAEPQAIERELIERGVLPDLLAPASTFAQCRHRLAFAERLEESILLSWRVDAAPARWLPKVDAIALDCLGSETTAASLAARRWMRLAPRYLGRLASNFRLLRCSRGIAEVFRSRVETAVMSGEIGVSVGISFNGAEFTQFDSTSS